MAQFAQGLGLDLADALAGHVELLAHFLEGVVGVHVDTESHSEYLGFTRGEAAQYRLGSFSQASGTVWANVGYSGAFYCHLT